MREWMYMRKVNRRRLNDQFVAGVDQFIEFGMSTTRCYPENPQLRCPCVRCKNKKVINPKDVKLHLLTRGFVPNYYHWISHGETDEMFAALQHEESRSMFDGGNGETHRRMEQRLDQRVGPGESFVETHTRSSNREEFVDQRPAEVHACTQNILSQMSSQYGTIASYQDECEAVGSVRLGGSVIGVGSVASDFFSEQISAPRREATHVVQISCDNAKLRTQVDNLELTVRRQAEVFRETMRRQAEEFRETTQRQRDEFNEFRRQMEQFMTTMNANPSASSSFRQPPDPFSSRLLPPDA